MADELVFYTNPMSRGRIMRWMLEEVGAALPDGGARLRHDDEGARLSRRQPDGQGAGDPPRRRRRDRGAAICAYLADAFPQAGLAPAPGERLRGPYYRWLFFGAGPIEAAATNKAMGFEVPPDRKPMAGYGYVKARSSS